ncbi:MAG: hypothetical protein ISS80_05770 [Candidatus Cloacimonetes bacterium]|nr:hypothetical protein [Candidatus Cloacimonadota bacterium]MBL7149563.1 hypothetical protein [Candidatus Cloacimonadota bacterium]
MKIESYSFGSIMIDEESYTSDLIIFPGKIDVSWWRKRSHKVEMEDIPELLEVEVDVIIFGTGAYGLMKIDKKVIVHFTNRNIELIIEKTGQAVNTYNEISENKKVIAALHLTC